MIQLQSQLIKFIGVQRIPKNPSLFGKAVYSQPWYGSYQLHCQ